MTAPVNTGRVMGLDLSSLSVAAAVLDQGHVMFEYHEVPKALKDHRPRALQYLRTALEPLLVTAEPSVCWVEEAVVAGARNLQSTIKVSYVVGMTMATAMDYAPSYFVSVSQWKKEVCGNGALDKVAVAEWVHEHDPVAYERAEGNQNLIDAYCIAKYGLIMQERTKALAS